MRQFTEEHKRKLIEAHGNYDDDLRKEVVDYYKSGFPISACVKKFKPSKGTLCKWIRNAGATRSAEEALKIRYSEGKGRTEKHHNWKGGRRLQEGYVMLNLGTKNKIRNDQFEHRLIAAKVLGRKLTSDECVHHINGVRSDNRHCNLLICTNAYHNWLNNRMAMLYMKEHFA